MLISTPKAAKTRKLEFVKLPIELKEDVEKLTNKWKEQAYNSLMQW